MCKCTDLTMRIKACICTNLTEQIEVHNKWKQKVELITINAR